MSDDYTPTTEEVANVWVDYQTEVPDDGAYLPMTTHAAQAEFDRWLAKVKVDTLRDAADEIRGVFSDPDRKRPRDPEGVVATDYLNDTGWTEHIVRARADRIEGKTDDN